MAFSSKAVQSIDDQDDDKSTEEGTDRSPKGPPSAKPAPRSASDSSLFSSAGRASMDESKSGLGAEGSDPSIIGTQGLALVQRGLQMLNLAFPDNPGLVAVLADITGRLQSIIPQLVASSTNGMGGMGLMGGQMGMQQGMPGMQPPSPMGAMGAPPQPMPVGGPQGGPQGPPMPPMQPQMRPPGM